MSLNYDLSEVDKAVRAEHYPAQEDGSLNVVTVGLIFSTMTIGMGTITDANAFEFYARTKLAERLYGPTVHQADGTEGFTLQDVLRHKGLRTNVFPQESRSSFLKRHCVAMLDESIWRARREQEREAERLRESGTHDEWCRARAVGIACRNLDDARENGEPVDDRSPLAVGDAYLESGTTGCVCGLPQNEAVDGAFVTVGRVAIGLSATREGKS